MIEVRLFATFREGRQKVYQFPGTQFQKAVEIVDYFDIPHDQVSIYLINGIHSKLTDAVNDGDVIALFPPVGGG